MPTDKLARLGLMTALGMIFSYVEVLLPILPGVPGVKLGLANALVILLLYSYGVGSCIVFQLCRILLSSILFGNLFGLFYSLAGAVVSLEIMILMKKLKLLDIPGISMIGGIFHNLAQLAVAFLFVRNTAVFYYVPALLISGALTGYVIGWIGEFLLKRKLL